MSKQYIFQNKDNNFIINLNFNPKKSGLKNELKILPESNSNHEGIPYFMIEAVLDWSRDSGLVKAHTLLKKYLSINNKLGTCNPFSIYFASHQRYNPSPRDKQLTTAAKGKISKKLEPYFNIDFIDKQIAKHPFTYSSKTFTIGKTWKTSITYEKVLGDQNVMGVSNASNIIKILKNLSEIEEAHYLEAISEIANYSPSAPKYEKTVEKEEHLLQIKYQLDCTGASLIIADLLYIMHHPIMAMKKELSLNGVEDLTKITMQEYQGFFANNPNMHEAKSYVYMAKTHLGEVGFIGLKNSKQTKNSEYSQKYSLTVVQNIANAVCFSTADLNLCGLGELRNKSYWPIVTPIECQQQLSIKGKVFEDTKMQLLASSIEKNKIENLLKETSPIVKDEVGNARKNKI